MYWTIIILSILLGISPFVLGFSSSVAALWTSLIVGVALLITGIAKWYKAAFVLGIWVFISAFILGFSSIPGALWTSLVIGAIIAVWTGIKWFGRRSLHRWSTIQTLLDAQAEIDILIMDLREMLPSLRAVAYNYGVWKKNE
jgi:branched-subunit amino acid ABC-type transport system permease component